jgi:hypothetical protein
MNQQHQQRPQALAAAVDDVAPQLVDQRHIGAQTVQNQAVNGQAVGAYQLADIVDIQTYFLFFNKFLHRSIGSRLSVRVAVLTGSLAVNSAWYQNPERLTQTRRIYRIAPLSGAVSLENQPCTQLS